MVEKVMQARRRRRWWCGVEEGQWGGGEVYKWDPSFFMHRGDIPPSANFRSDSPVPWLIDICIRDLC